MTITDADIRQQALDIHQSYIVQAPAGSGKTELLTQRLLKLLAAVKQPEEIIAITFTRKAAAEMRQRVMEALALAQCHESPSEPHKQTTYQLASAVLERDHQQQWGLTNNTNRLRIITIDALAAFICRHTPLLSGIDPSVQISDNASVLYQQAIHQLLNQTQRDDNLQQAVNRCLLQLDNVMPYFEHLLKQMLAKRDQWLPQLMPHYRDRTALKQQLENCLHDVVQQTLNQAMQAFNLEQRQQLVNHLCFGASHIEDRGSLIAQHGEDSSALNNEPEQLPRWQAIAELLLTQKNEWRSQVNKRMGFPADKKEEKQALKQLITELQANDEALNALIAVRQSPPTRYLTSQWQLLDSLLTVLPQLVAQLQWVFNQQRQVDFVEINLAANQALGDQQQPTDLALYLDYKIQHLLIDEFQDTSITHFRLLEKIMREWMPDDGRSVFLVGDPMQSIYRFRQAEVGLFLHVQQNGIGHIHPTSLQLVSNFRSNGRLVDWFNQAFSHIFPKRADISSGAVNYHAASAVQPTHATYGVNYYALDISDDDEAVCVDAESQCIVDIIQRLDNSEENIAILVRSRSQLTEIIPALRQAKLPYQAVDIEPLLIQPEIERALTLTRALLHLADRIAWLALLRSEACGLLLADLLMICQAANDKPLWPTLTQFDSLALSQDATQRLRSIVPVIDHCLQQQGRLPLASWVKYTWQQLNLDSTLNDDNQRANLQTFFDTLHQVDQSTSTMDITQLMQQLSKSYTKTVNANDARIHIMTIHKSKGLEFDHVILPNLERAGVKDRPELLLWQQNHFHGIGRDLILAPIKSPEQKADGIYQYCQRIEQQKLAYENTRLLYVAATRAKQSLHLISTDIESARSNSFLHLLQPVLPEAQTVNAVDDDNDAVDTLETAGQVKRAHALAPSPYMVSSKFLPDLEAIPGVPTALLEPTIHQLSGTLLHQQLHRLALLQTQHVDRECIRAQAQQLGLSSQHIDQVLPRVEQALINTLQDPQGRWILAPHQDSHCEYTLHQRNGAQVQTFIVDRTFVDQGVRWIIDYKSASPCEGQSIDDFVEQQYQHYAEQLQQYAALFQQLENRPIQTALYFPLVPGIGNALQPIDLSN